MDRLPGYPDGITRVAGSRGFWVALTLPRQPLADYLRWRCAARGPIWTATPLPVPPGWPRASITVIANNTLYTQPPQLMYLVWAVTDARPVVLHRVVRFIVAWLPSWVRPPLDEWGAIVEVRLVSTTVY